MTTWRMPAETERHERAWMAWPSAAYTLGETAADADEAWTAWAAVANAIADHEQLSMVVTPEGAAEARRRLSGAIELHEAPLDDAWYRDIGPTFVVDDAGRLGAVSWIFNGWGQQQWASWEHDARASDVATAASGAVRIDSPMVNEGGGIHTDGRGTFLVTETVQLDPGRNPGWSKGDVEAELARTVGARTVVWLPRGLHRDAQTYGTRGHVDIVATFTEPGKVLVHHQRDAAHPDHEVSREVADLLAGSTDADGRALEVTLLPAPTTLTDDEGFVDYSYVNHFVLNGAVVACSFADPVDAEAAEILAAVYPGRAVITADARALFARGGGIHCITQQQPAIPATGGTP
ncbi:agmatine deiminase family protein [Nocardioides mangrovi]|uniref:Agmatine deiminase family protein n=1 Tax=Nocardioides mangrovi TaxID=2874580 RepID=A0ABS7UE32_9ACTN|nr:agmatine deiminase family protein [Nocardioides mangrovi]MBZ5739254.1 agmatine deiminase family protein [Nocardioides mangrovi]